MSFLESSKLFLKRNSSNILTCIGAIGVIATSVTAVKSTPKAMLLLDKAKEEKGEDLTKLEIVRVAGPGYIPSIVMGVSTIACIFGANALNKHQQATIMSAYALLDNSYKEYKNKVKEVLGEEVDYKVREEIAKDRYNEDENKPSKGKELFLDFSTLQYFESTVDDVLQKVTMDDGLECYVITTPFV